LSQFVERSPHTIGLVAVRLEKALHVEQRKTLRSYLRLIACGEHRFEHRGLIDWPVVLEGEERRHRGRTTAEVVLLMPGPAEGTHQLEFFDGVHAHVEAFQ